jgi:2',3'-cyclic-nucleotide 2'-phosphodiesterase/3'-nucleotidase
MNRNHTVISLVLGVSMAVTACASAAEKITAELTILHTSDLHGAVLPFNDYANRPSDIGSLAQVATMVQEIRATADHPVMVLDSGDTLQGPPLEQFAHVRWGEPRPPIEAMNRIGYQAMAVGNHEFNFGLEVLERARKQAKFPFLSANILRENTGELAFEPYAIFEQGRIRVGVLGLITPNIPGWEKPENYRGLVFEPMDDAARRWVPVLREKERCDVVVVLAHTGFEHDPETGEADGTAHENFVWRLTAVPGIDVLLTGHTHEDIPPRLVRGVYVAQPWARARMLTRIDLRLERDEHGWHITERRGENLPTKGVPGDKELIRAHTLIQQRVQTALDGPVGEVTHEVRVDRCRLEDCAAVDLVHQVQMHASGVHRRWLHGRWRRLDPPLQRRQHGRCELPHRPDPTRGIEDPGSQVQGPAPRSRGGAGRCLQLLSLSRRRVLSAPRAGGGRVAIVGRADGPDRRLPQRAPAVGPGGGWELANRAGDCGGGVNSKAVSS